MAVTEALSDEEAYLLAILTDASGLDLAEFCFYDPVDEEDGVNDGCWRARPYQWPWFRCDAPLQIDQCVAAGQRVCTARGWVPIENVIVGDQVLTHQGRWKPVTWRWCQGEQDVVSVRGHGHPGLLVTPDHRLWARRARRASQPRDGHKGKKLLEPEWIAPSSWEWNDDSGVMVANWASPASVGGLGLVPPMERVTRSTYRVQDTPDPAWLWLYGLFLAEGSFYALPPTRRVLWSVHRDEADEVEKRLRSVGLRPHLDRRGSCVVLRVDSASCYSWLLDHAGRGAGSKRLAPWVYGLSVTQRTAVLDGLLFGDGYYRAETRTWSYTTISHELALGVKLLAQTLGCSAALRMPRVARTETIQGRVVQCRPQWTIDLKPLAEQTKAQVQEIDGVMWAPVKAVIPAGRVLVYDLEVEDDHSFVVEGVIVKNCARDVGKSLGIQMRAFVHPFAHPGAEMVITAPELIHLEPITQAIEHRVFSTRLSTEMMPRARSRLTRRPFRLNFTTGARIVGRIPQVTGRGVKGLHPKILELDEAQDYPDAGWTEITATLRRGIRGAIWRTHGVTRGVRDKFWEFTQPGQANPWKVHRITALSRPDWTDQERQLNIQLYGSRESPDYRRNILGLHGDQSNVLFVISRLMRCVDSVEASIYNTEEYQRFRITAEMLEDLAGEGSSQEEQARAAEQLLDFNETHSKYEIFWAGCDVGFTADPTEILVAAEYVPDAAERRIDKAAHRASPEAGVSRLRVVVRIHLERISSPVQEAIILHVIAHFAPKAFGMDATGNGLPLYQNVLATDIEVAKIVRGYNFSSNVIVDIDGTIEVADQADILKEAAITSNVLEYSTDALRELVDAARWIMPWDREVITQFSGQTWSYSKGLIGADERRRRRVFSAGHYHALDAARMLAMAHAQAPIEATVESLKHPEYEPVYDVFVSG